MCMFSLSGKLVSEFNYKLLYWPLHRAQRTENKEFKVTEAPYCTYAENMVLHAALESEISYPHVLVIYDRLRCFNYSLTDFCRYTFADYACMYLQ